MDYAVCIDIEADLNLRDSAGSGCNAGELESTKGLVILSKFTLALKDMDFNAGLTIGSS